MECFCIALFLFGVVMEILEFFKLNISELLTFVLDGNQRIFWGYIASSIVLAFIVYRWQLIQSDRNGFVRYLFPKRIYTHSSAVQDYILLITNKFIKALLFPIVLFTSVPIAVAISDAFSYLYDLQPIVWSGWAVTLTFTIILFIFDDFTRFFLHYILHKVPFLWEFHKVHHSAKVLTPFTIYRSHPVENFLYASRMAIAQGGAIGVGFYLFGASEHLNMIAIVEANIFIFLFNVFGSNLRHSHIWLGFGDKVESVFISPAQHQIHHSLAPEHFDTNFGTALAIWDKWFGCLVKSSTVPGVEVGLSESQADHSSIAKIYLEPFARIFRPSNYK